MSHGSVIVECNENNCVGVEIGFSIICVLMFLNLEETNVAPE